MTRVSLWWRLLVAALLSRSDRAFYDRIAPFYDELFTEHQQHADRMVELLSSDHTAGKADTRVLDLGCGTGLLMRRVAEQGFSVTGLDISLASLERISTHNGEVIQGDAARLPFRDDSFQAIVSLGAWRHFPAPHWVMAECLRTLMPGGVLIIGYFPPALGGLVHVGQGVWGRLLGRLYQWFIRWRGYVDRADLSLSPETLELARGDFDEVQTVSSGAHWHLIRARRPRQAVTEGAGSRHP